MRPLSPDQVLTDHELSLFVDSPCQLLLAESDVVDTHWPVIVLLHARGILVLKRTQGIVGFDVEQAVEQFDFEWEAPVLQHTGKRLLEDMVPPNVLFLGATAHLRDYWEFVHNQITFQPLAEGFAASAQVRDVYPFVHWLDKIGILALIRSCGWHLLTTLNVDPDFLPREVYLLTRCDRLAMSPRALCQLILTRIFIMHMRLYEEAPKMGDQVFISVKLWKSWIWHGVAGSQDNTKFIHDAWHFAHRLFGDTTPIRLVANGVQVNQDWPIHHYIRHDEHGRPTLKIHVVLQLQGGGPPAVPSPRHIHEAFSFDELEDLDRTDSNRLISVLIQNMVDQPVDEAHLDIEVLRDAVFRIDHSGFSLVSSIAVVIRFMRDLQATGVEPLLRALGWHSVMSLADHREPVQAQLHITPKVGVRHIRDATVRVFLMYALAIRAMPVPRGVLGGIYVKVKLVDSWVLVGHYPEDMQMGSFARSWRVPDRPPNRWRARRAAATAILPYEASESPWPRDLIEEFWYVMLWDLTLPWCLQSFRQWTVAPDEISYYLLSRADVAQFRYLPCLCVTADVGTPGTSHRPESVAWFPDHLTPHAQIGSYVPEGTWGPLSCLFPVITERLYRKCDPRVASLQEIARGCPQDWGENVDTWLGSCFTHVPHDQLPCQRAPVVLDSDQLAEVRSMYISKSQRLQILSHQDLLWADDELNFHFKCIQTMAGEQGFPICVLDPLLTTSWLEHGNVDATTLDIQGITTIVTAVKIQYHWLPLVIVKTGSMVNVHTWHHRTQEHPWVSALVLNVATAWVALDFRWIIHHTRHAIEHHCGPMAVALVLHVVLQVPAPKGVSDIFRVQLLLRQKFVSSLTTLCPAPRMWASGVNEQAADELTPVLIEHGVPKDLAQVRAQAAVKAIGGSLILGQDPAGQGVVGRPKGARKSKKLPPSARDVRLDPAKLCLPDCFFAAGGKSLSQIPLSAVGPLAEGVALVTQFEAAPYLQQGQAVSNHPLALLIVQPELPLQTSLAHTPVTVPCKCLANNEPILLDGVLCQIGSGFVEKGQTMSQVAVEVVNVGTIKFTVYRDEVEGTWETFTEGPLRYIVAKIPLLRLCHQENCHCSHWHNPEKLAVKEVIVDVWRRQFLQSNFRPETALQASMYSVCIRIPECLVQDILAVSGTAGIYPEPRTLDARSVHPDFAMVWLPKMSRAQLNHLKQTTPAAIGVGRVGERVGLRVFASDAAAVHGLLKPEAVFLPSGPRHEFLTGPFPFGSDRSSLMRAFKALKWEARPVQPMSSVDSKGSMWLVQANQEPPDTILTMAHGDVVVTRYRPTKETKDQKPRPIASAATLALCGDQGQESKDPWISGDPWGGYQATTSRNPVVPVAAKGLRQLETSLENRLKKAVLDSLPVQPTPMERDDVPDRVCQLESQISQLLGKHSQLETQVSEHAKAQAAQMASMQGQLQSQHQLLHGHIESSQQNIAAMFETQMAQIRSLMAKRPRDDQE
eukprot:s1577_g11.t1